jgi:hypothetical protein
VFSSKIFHGRKCSRLHFSACLSKNRGADEPAFSTNETDGLSSFKMMSG